MRRCNVTGDNTLQPVTICMNSREDTHSSWKGSVKMECSKMRLESSEYTWKTKAILIYWESYFEERAQAVCERNRMDPHMHTTLWNVNIRKPIELMVFREQSEGDDQMNTAGELVILIPVTSREW